MITFRRFGRKKKEKEVPPEILRMMLAFSLGKAILDRMEAKVIQMEQEAEAINTPTREESQ